MQQWSRIPVAKLLDDDGIHKLPVSKTKEGHTRRFLCQRSLTDSGEEHSPDLVLMLFEQVMSIAATKKRKGDRSENKYAIIITIIITSIAD